MKKLMILGGSRYILPVIETAHKLGIYVITCDYLPGNAAHRYSDEYCNVSVIDREAVLAAAREKRIDGIMSFACDPGVTSAAYTAEKMGLPFQCPYESARILQDKGLFRSFLSSNGFNCPHSKSYTDMDEPFNDTDLFDWPVIIKPVDSAGSKGVTRADRPEELRGAIKTAVENSHNGAFIIEDFITFKGFHSSADLFTVKGELRFVTYSDQLFDTGADNRYTPAMIIWPSTMPEEHQSYLTKETQRLMKLLRMGNGIYNVETCVGSDGTPYIMEVSPRGGGCRIAEIQEMAMGAELIENEVRSALGMPLLEINMHKPDGHWCEAVIHARPGQTGILKEIGISQPVRDKHLKFIGLSAEPGDRVRPFTGANASLGDMFLRFDTREQLDRIMSGMDRWLQIDCVKESIAAKTDKNTGGRVSKT